MGKSAPDQETMAVYDEGATRYDSLPFNPKELQLLSQFVKMLPPHAHVLDLGSGPGRYGVKIAEHGHRVLCIDASKEMVKLANQQNSIEARLASFEDFFEDDHCDKFHAVWANFSLLHAKRSDAYRIIAAIVKALKEDGVFHIALKTGNGEARDRLGRRYTYFMPDEIEQLLKKHDLKIENLTQGYDIGFDGKAANWFAFQSRKT